MTNEIEKTRRQMYADLKRFEHMVGSTHLFKTLQDSLEEHLEALRVGMKNREDVGQSFGESLGRIVSERDSLIQKLSSMTEERDQIQQRLHAIDHAYCEQSNRAGAQAREIERLNELNRITGQELIRVQGIARQHLDDCRSAEKLSDSLDEKLRDARTVIGQQEQLIVGQRLAIADLYLAGRRLNSAVATLQRLGYTDCGGQLWKPPIGKKPDFSKDYCETCEGLGYVHCNGGRPTAPCPEGCQ